MLSTWPAVGMKSNNIHGKKPSNLNKWFFKRTKNFCWSFFFNILLSTLLKKRLYRFRNFFEQPLHWTLSGECFFISLMKTKASSVQFVTNTFHNRIFTQIFRKHAQNTTSSYFPTERLFSPSRTEKSQQIMIQLKNLQRNFWLFNESL